MATSFVDLKEAEGEISFHYACNPKPRLELSVYDETKPFGMESSTVEFDNVQLARLKKIKLTIRSFIDYQIRQVTFTPLPDGTINMNIQEPEHLVHGLRNHDLVMSSSDVRCFTGKIIEASLEHRLSQEMAVAVNSSPAR